MSGADPGFDRLMADADAQAEELRLLRRLWHFIYNEKGDLDYGDHSGCTWEDIHQETVLAEAVEDHYIEHGFPTIEKDD